MQRMAAASMQSLKSESIARKQPGGENKNPVSYSEPPSPAGAGKLKKGRCPKLSFLYQAAAGTYLKCIKAMLNKCWKFLLGISKRRYVN